MSGSFRGAAGCLAAFLFLTGASPAPAQDVTLTSPDGAIELSGTLQAFDGEFYRVNTIYGLLTLAAEGVQCDGPGCPDLTSFVAEIRLSGARLLGERLMPALVRDFADSEGLALQRGDAPERGADVLYLLRDRSSGRVVVRISIRGRSSDQGLIDLLSGEADIALSLSELQDPEVHVRVVAQDAFVPVVGQGNPLRAMTLPELAGALSGGIDSWADFGWLDAPITVHALRASAGAQQAMEAALLAPLGLPMGPDAQRHDSEAALLAAVAADPFAIGVALWSETGAARTVRLQGGCGLEMPATPLAIKAEDYPLTAPLLLHTRTGRLPLQVRRFLAHAASQRAQGAIRLAGFIDQGPEAQALSAQGRRLANAILAAGDGVGLEDLQRLVTAMDGAERLSPTFRFESGTSTLDVQSRSNVLGLARDLEAGLFDGREIVLAGFTDSAGSVAANLRLSEARAAAVRDALLAAAPLLQADAVRITTAGFGQSMPMACDDTEWGRRVNRRVETWLR